MMRSLLPSVWFKTLSLKTLSLKTLSLKTLSLKALSLKTGAFKAGSLKAGSLKAGSLKTGSLKTGSRRWFAVLRWRSHPLLLGLLGLGSAIAVALSGVGDRAIARSPWPAANVVTWPAQTQPDPSPNTVSILSLSTAWREVYAQMPDLPLENQYIDQETGAPAENHTLALRLIRYHIYLKGRSPMYRLDWRLTLADYLGVNQYLVDEVYPGYERLDPNPADGDIAAIRSLSRRQRTQLVDTLVAVFNPNANHPNPPQPNATGDRPPSSPPTREPETVNPQPGDAQRLLGP